MMIIFAKNNYKTSPKAVYEINTHFGTDDERRITHIRGAFEGLTSGRFMDLVNAVESFCLAEGKCFWDMELCFVIDGKKVDKKAFFKSMRG